MKFLYVLILFTLVSLFANAQPDFHKGFIVTNNGDTLQGFINYKNDISLSKKCEFKSSKRGKKQIYSPLQIHSFCILGQKYYISKEINGDKRFLDCLVKGDLSIYISPHKFKDLYFIEKGNSFTTITFNDSIIEKNGKTYQIKDNRHKTILHKYTLDVVGLNTEIEKMEELNKNNLSKLAIKYNKNSKKQQPYYEYFNKKQLYVSITPFAGIKFIPKSQLTAYEKSSFLTKAIILDFGLERFKERLFLRTGLESTSFTLTNNDEIRESRVLFSLGYSSPKSFLISPNFSVNVFSPNYMFGVKLNLHKRLIINALASIEYEKRFLYLPMIPSELKYFSLLGGLTFNF